MLKLTPNDVRNILLDHYVDCRTVAQICSEYGVSRTTVTNIIKRRTWKWVEV